LKYFHPILCFFLPPIPPGGAFNPAPERKVPLGGPDSYRDRGRSSVGESFRFGLLIILQLFISFCLKGQSLNYPDIFGDDWKKAEQFVTGNEKWIRPVLEKYRVDYYEAISVVFPELVRYSALRDKMEITLLKALYINLGEEYANFSIGHFQMKPSFAETIIKEGMKLTGRKTPLVRDSTGYEDIRNYRAAIVSSLEDINSQLDYLVVFFKIAGKKFDLKKMDEHSRITFLAAAYNYGPLHSEMEITEMSSRKFFSTKLVSRDLYSYADISLYWYNHVTRRVEGK
jgi:hypothetical protein